MDKRQTRNDERDNKRAFRWGTTAAIVLVVLAIAAYSMLSSRREAEPTMQPSAQPATSEPAKPPGQ